MASVGCRGGDVWADLVVVLHVLVVVLVDVWGLHGRIADVQAIGAVLCGALGARY